MYIMIDESRIQPGNVPSLLRCDFFKDGSFTCNHGEKECEANRLQSCVLDTVNLKYSVPFIVCFENALNSLDVNEALTHCSSPIHHELTAIR